MPLIVTGLWEPQQHCCGAGPPYSGTLGKRTGGFPEREGTGHIIYLFLFLTHTLLETYSKSLLGAFLVLCA
jgi:hypothetical protein